MKAILRDHKVPTMEQIIRFLRFLEKVTVMPGGRLTPEFLRSHAKAIGCTHTRPKDAIYGRGMKSCVRTLQDAGLLDSPSNDGVFDKGIHRVRQRDIGLHIEEQPGLVEAGTSQYDSKGRSKTRI
jgi:hypothetical protein